MDAILDAILNAKHDVKVDVTPNTKVDTKYDFMPDANVHKNECHTKRKIGCKKRQHQTQLMTQNQM